MMLVQPAHDTPEVKSESAALLKERLVTLVDDEHLSRYFAFLADHCVRAGDFKAVALNADGKVVSSCLGPLDWSVSHWACVYADRGDRVVMIKGRA